MSHHTDIPISLTLSEDSDLCICALYKFMLTPEQDSCLLSFCNIGYQTIKILFKFMKMTDIDLLDIKKTLKILHENILTCLTNINQCLTNIFKI